MIRYSHTYNVVPTEFEIQSLAFTNLRTEYPIVRGEYSLPVTENHTHRILRFDIAIFNTQRELKLIIEIKRNNKNPNRITQVERYSELSKVPCMLLIGMKEAFNARILVKEFININQIVIDTVS